jgi:hypothetical protein
VALNLYLSTAESPRNANVVSQLNPVPIKMRDLVYQDNLPVNIYVADGSGNYDDRSGNAAYTIETSIGIPGTTPIWLSQNWTLITNGWFGSIQTTAAAFLTQFVATGMNPINLVLEVKLINAQGAATTIAQLPVNVYNDQFAITPNPDVLVNAIRGSYNLISGADSGTVTGLGLVTTPVQVLFHPIRKPANGLNIFPTPVNGTLTTDGFSFSLDGIPDSNGYWLDYIITFS